MIRSLVIVNSIGGARLVELPPPTPPTRIKVWAGPGVKDHIEYSSTHTDCCKVCHKPSWTSPQHEVRLVLGFYLTRKNLNGIKKRVPAKTQNTVYSILTTNLTGVSVSFNKLGPVTDISLTNFLHFMLQPTVFAVL